jgi:formamidopyrimidine-DNA glycosylase
MPELPEVETIKNKLRFPVETDVKLGKKAANGVDSEIPRPDV